MAGGDELEARIGALEDRTAQAEADAAAARYLASECDQDVAEMKQAIGGFRRSLRAVDRNVSDLRRDVDAGFREMRSEMQGGLELMAAGFEAVHERLDRLAGES